MNGNNIEWTDHRIGTMGRLWVDAEMVKDWRAVVDACKEKVKRYGYCPVCEAVLTSIDHLPDCPLKKAMEDAK